MKIKSIIFLIGLSTMNIVYGQISVWDGSHTTWTNGIGTENSPYLIESAAQLAHLAYYVNNFENEIQPSGIIPI